MNSINYKDLKFIHFFSNLPLFVCEGSFFCVQLTMETENIDGKKKYKLHFNTRWSEPTQQLNLTTMKN